MINTYAVVGEFDDRSPKEETDLSEVICDGSRISRSGIFRGSGRGRNSIQKPRRDANQNSTEQQTIANGC